MSADDKSRQIMTLYEALTPTQRLFVMARAQGKTVRQAAKDAGVARTSPTTNWDMDAINAAILEVQERMIKDSAAALQHILPDAISQLETAVHNGDLNAIKEVFARIWGKPVDRKELSGPDGGAIPIQHTLMAALEEGYSDDSE